MNTREFNQTITVNINTPNHEQRKRSTLFVHSRLELIAREGGCFICGRNAEQTGHPLEAHHHPIEWSMSNMVDWERLRDDCKRGLWGPHAAGFDWDAFFINATLSPFDFVDDESGHAISTTRLIPRDPYLFIDDMRVNGMLLCKEHHVHDDAGMHMMPFPLWIAQKYAVEGYQFSKSGQINHGDPANE